MTAILVVIFLLIFFPTLLLLGVKIAWEVIKLTIVIILGIIALSVAGVM